MKTDNELIADFMGEVLTEEDHAHNFTIEQLPYRTSWNWLMPVVQRIKNQTSVEDFNYDAVNMAEFRTRKAVVMDQKITQDIKVIYLRCAEFIKWYNEKK